MRLIIASVVSIFSLSQIAAREPARCPACRAQYTFGDCPITSIEDPHKASISFWGQVLATKKTDCGTLVTVRVARSSSPLPKMMMVDVQPCSFWHGAIGEIIRAAVGKIDEQTGVYHSSIYCEAKK